jgi:ABC-type branched-subunit amino acid transport system substrate-binding protein
MKIVTGLTAIGLVSLFCFVQADKANSNLSIAVILPYMLDDTNGVNPPPSNSITANVIANSAAAEMAIEDINNDPTVFPNSKIDMVSINSWDAEIKDYMTFSSGAYASIKTLSAYDQGIIGAVGDYLSSSSEFTAQILSDFNIHFCGSTQTAGTFSDKNNYPYFIRLQPGYALGSAILSLVQQWNIQRYSLVVGYDSSSLLTIQDVTTVLQSAKQYQLVNKIIITPNMQDKSDYSYPITLLKKSQVKYVFVIASSDLTADFYYAARY